MSVTAQSRPIDLVHLSRYTGGDTELNAEVLTLFAGQAEQIVARLRICLEKCDAVSWHEATHALKGAARGVGAFDLADAAAAAEQLNLAAQGKQAALAVETMRSLAHATKVFVENYLSAA
jgi:HPt (histidine-containing phosphotransfer) domain-containing protein